MFRKRNFFCSILFRISIWYLLLGIIGVTSLYYLMEAKMRQNTEKYIAEELLRVKENARLYVCQVLMLHNNQINGEGFKRYIGDIEEQFKVAGYRETAFYGTDGQVVEGRGNKNLDGETKRKDFGLAIKQKSSFTLHYGADKSCDVYFSMPVKVHNEQLGIISFYFDYSEVYEREWKIFNSMLRGVILVVGGIYIIIWLLVRRLIMPIRSLTVVSQNISSHFEDGKLDTELLSNERFYKRRDEIGELSRNYRKMIDVTKEQFDKIEHDRQHILSLLNSRQEFYNSITHELKTPLAIISGYAQLIGENSLSDTELFHNGMEQILHESERLHQMVVELLEMQDNGEVLETEEVDLTLIIKNVTELMKLKAERYGNTIVLDIKEGSYIVKGRKDRLHQVMINLIDNAVKYGETKKEIIINMQNDNDFAKIDVINQGKGLKEHELKRIFEPFFRVDKDKSRELGSAGLGLSIVKKIMDEHGGKIEVHSVYGKDTVFSVYLPLLKKYIFLLILCLVCGTTSACGSKEVTKVIVLDEKGDKSGENEYSVKNIKEYFYEGICGDENWIAWEEDAENIYNLKKSDDGYEYRKIDMGRRKVVSKLSLSIEESDVIKNAKIAPGGKYIAYEKKYETDMELFLYYVESDELFFIYSADEIEFEWSGDGKKLFYSVIENVAGRQNDSEIAMEKKQDSDMWSLHCWDTDSRRAVTDLINIGDMGRKKTILPSRDGLQIYIFNEERTGEGTMDWFITLDENFVYNKTKSFTDSSEESDDTIETSMYSNKILSINQKRTIELPTKITRPLKYTEAGFYAQGNDGNIYLVTNLLKKPNIKMVAKAAEGEQIYICENGNHIFEIKHEDGEEQFEIHSLFLKNGGVVKNNLLYKDNYRSWTDAIVSMDDSAIMIKSCEYFGEEKYSMKIIALEYGD